MLTIPRAVRATSPCAQARPGGMDPLTLRTAAALALATPLVAALLAAAGELRVFPSVVLCAVLTAAGAAVLRRSVTSALPMAHLGLVAYALAAVIGALVLLNNQQNFGLPFGVGFDESFYWFNTESISGGGHLGEVHATLFEHLCARYHALLALGGDVTPGEMLPVNWALSALTLCAVFGVSEALLGAAPPLGLSLLATYGNAQFCLCVPHFYRDMLVTLGFVLAALYALRGRIPLALLGVGVALGTRTAHGFLALLLVATVAISRTRAFRRQPRVFAAGLVIAGLLGAAVVSRGSAAMLSGRGGESDSRDVVSYAITRQEDVVSHLSGESSYGAQVIALGPLGIPLRMVSGYFAPVSLVSPMQERSYNTLMLPGRLGDQLRVQRFVSFMLVYWVTVLAWPVLAAPLLLGMRRLELAGGTPATLMRALALCFFLIMVISMQERHRVPVLAFNPLFLAAWRRAPPDPQERRLARAITGLTLLAIGALNLWVLIRGG